MKKALKEEQSVEDVVGISGRIAQLIKCTEMVRRLSNHPITVKRKVVARSQVNRGFKGHERIVTIEKDESLTIHIPIDRGIKPKFLLRSRIIFR
jgi:hypothetical protein